jgi:hypothetical protein
MCQYFGMDLKWIIFGKTYLNFTPNSPSLNPGKGLQALGWRAIREAGSGALPEYRFCVPEGTYGSG